MPETILSAEGGGSSTLSKLVLDTVIQAKGGKKLSTAQTAVAIASLIQQPGECGHPSGQVPLVMMTHSATEGAAGSAMEEIEKLPSVRGPGVRMRVLS